MPASITVKRRSPTRAANPRDGLIHDRLRRQGHPHISSPSHDIQSCELSTTPLRASRMQAQAKEANIRKTLPQLETLASNSAPHRKDHGRASLNRILRTRMQVYPHVSCFRHFLFLLLFATRVGGVWKRKETGSTSATVRTVLYEPTKCYVCARWGKYAIVLWSATSWALIYYTPCSHAVDHVVSASDVEVWLFWSW